MKNVLIFICIGVPMLFWAQDQRHFHDKPASCLTQSTPSLYNWQDIEQEFGKRINISLKQTKSFFLYATKWRYLKMEDYFRLVKEGAITKNNAQKYWLDKLPYFEDIYKYKYLPDMEKERAGEASGLNNRNNSVNQTMASCNNLDFSAGNLSNWVGKWNNAGSSGAGTGTGYGALTVNGFNSSPGSSFNDMGYVHELCNGGTDPLVPINRVAPGHTYSLRLGDDSAYIENSVFNTTNTVFPYNHQTISNTFSVTPTNRTITYWYAVVLDQNQSNPHPPSEQPYFKIRMYDGSGNEIVCARYDVDVSQAASVGGFDSLILPNNNPNSINGNFQVFYKNWTPVFIPLINYVGQNVTITFESSDCDRGGHFGYAYLAVDCAPFPGITFNPFFCGGPTTTVLTAPPGVATYSWVGPGVVGPANNQTVTVNSGGTYTVNMTTIGNGGVTCPFKIDTIVKGAPPVPVATFNNNSPCVGNATNFTNLSTGGPFIKQIWHFGDGAIDSTHTSPTHVYASPGTYTVSLFVNNGCVDTYTTTVTVNPSPTSVFSSTPVCQGAVTSFTNTSAGGVSYQWNFGNGSGTSTNQNPSYTYANSGTFVVTLTVTNSFNCKTVSTNTAIVNPYPVVTYSSPPVCLGTPTVFNNSSTPAIGVIYSWNFGDPATIADTSNLQNPTYLYPSTGTYTVTLTVTPASGCATTKTNIVTVNPIPTVSVSPGGIFCWNDLVPAPTATFTPNNPNVTFSWVNTNAQIGLSLSGNGVPPQFTAGLNNTLSNISGIISVTPHFNGCIGPPASYTVSVKPTPIVTYSNVNYCPGDVTNAITFTASPPAATANITWSTTATPFIGLSVTNGTTLLPSFTAISHVPVSQSNTVVLHTNLNGCVGPTSTFYIAINANPIAKFSYLSACTGNPTSFIDYSYTNSGFISHWEWHFGTDSSAQQNPYYQFNTVGNHTVNLQVTSNLGCKKDTTETVYVNQSAALSFWADTVSCSPLVTTFTNVVSMPVSSWIWNFGNGDTATYTTQTAATQTYVNNSHTQDNHYTVSLSVVTDSGCVTNVTKNNYITVYPNPIAGFAWGPSNADILDPTVNFHNQSIGASGENAYNWNFGDIYETVDSLNYANIANPTHVYSNVPYKYDVMLMVENIHGCKDSIKETVIIHDAVTFYIPNAFSPNNDDTNDGFKGTGIGIDNSTYNLWIFDRWGLMIFHATDLEKSWDGRLNGVKVQEDVYVWKVSFTDDFRKEHNYHGTVTVVR